MPARTPAIEISGLVKDYRGLRPLRLGSLRVLEGERVAISGLDATAAEVLVNVLNAAITPDEGEVRILGRPTSAIDTEAGWFDFLNHFGIVTPRAVLLEGSTVQQNLALPFTLAIDDLTPEVDQRTRELARLTGIDERWLGHTTGETPAAVHMRVHLARALALGPQILLLEHPTARIDPADVRAFATTVRDTAVAGRLTVLAITEDRAFADVVAERAYRLQPGTGALAAARGWQAWFAPRRAG
jgi:ABC-type transporter Mla maintaining outer membrane lipid asymmetry ATPase subunit MlaF